MISLLGIGTAGENMLSAFKTIKNTTAMLFQQH